MIFAYLPLYISLHGQQNSPGLLVVDEIETLIISCVLSDSLASRLEEANNFNGE